MQFVRRNGDTYNRVSRINVKYGNIPSDEQQRHDTENECYGISWRSKYKVIINISKYQKNT